MLGVVAFSMSMVGTFLVRSGILTSVHAFAVDPERGTFILVLLGIFIGGTTWSWLYLTYRNIWAAYVSHVFADVIIFAIGYGLVFPPS